MFLQPLINPDCIILKHHSMLQNVLICIKIETVTHHGCDDTADVDGVTASGNVVSWVPLVFDVVVEYFHANLHHILFKLENK